MKMPRFVKEYATYVKKEYADTDKISEVAYCTIIDRVVKNCEMGIITPSEAIKRISNYDMK